MKCQQCGADLRPDAHFCNVCGARQQSAGDQPGDSISGTAATGVSEVPAEAETSSGRAKRPARIPRAEAGDVPRSRETAAPVLTDALELAEDGESFDQVRSDDGDVEEIGDSELVEAQGVLGEGMNTAQTDADESVGEDRPESNLGAAAGNTELSAEGSAPNADVQTNGSPSWHEDAAAAEPMTPGHPSELPHIPDWTEVETAEYSTILATSHPAKGTSPSSASGMPALGDLSRTQESHQQAADHEGKTSWRDGMPWPLPPSIIVGGRYRVEAVISTMPEDADAENTYRVRDLQGYERCWSCGAVHGAVAATETFCAECGADMLARDYLMIERYAAVNEADAVVDRQSDEENAVDDEDNAVSEFDVRKFTQGARSYRVTPLVAEASLFPRGAHIVAAAATDTGASRSGEANEDSVGFVVLSLAHESRTEPFALAIVADGLGGHANGQAASRLVVQRLSERVLRSAALPFTNEPRAAGHATFESVALAALREGIEDANVALCEQNAASGADMGSTLVALLAFGTMAYVANVGDSRAYVLDDAGLRRITTDHSLVEQLVAAGQIAPEDRYTHPQRNQILRSIGDEPEVRADEFQQQLRPGMRFLLCSDGLWEMVRDDSIERILTEAVSPQQACDLLIEEANANGGEDNIGAVVVEISG